MSNHQQSLERLDFALILVLVAIVVIATLILLEPEYGNILIKANEYFHFQEVIQ